MNSKARAFILAAVVASIAVLAVLPADDVSADSSVTYVTTESGYSVFDITIDAACPWVVLTIGDYSGANGNLSQAQTSYSIAIHHEYEDGTYDYVLADQYGTQLGTGPVTIGAVPAVEYGITVAASENGTVTSSVTTAKAGDSVTLTVAPAQGYELDALTVDGSAVAVTDNSYTFEMPAHAVSVSATFKATTPVDPDQKYTVSYGENLTVTDEQGNAIASGSEVAANAVIIVTAEKQEGKVAKITPAVADDGKYTVTGTVVFTVSYEDEANTGIYADGEYQDSIADAIDAVKDDASTSAPGVVTISKDITEDITLAKNVRVDVTKDGSYTGTITYDGSVVKVVKLGDKSDVKIRGGSVEISGDFAGDSEFEVTAGTAVLSGTIAKDTNIKVTVADGATLQIGDLKVVDSSDTGYFTSSSLQIIATDYKTAVKFQEGTTYVGPAVIDSEKQVVDNIAYNEGSRIYFNERGKDVYENIYHLISGAIDITVGVADIVVPYTGEEITNSVVRTQTVRVDSYTDPYQPTSAAVPSLVEGWNHGASIMAPGAYNKAVEVFVVGGQGAQGLSRVLLADLTISPIPTHTITWANYDGSVIKTEQVAEGTVPAYTGDTPVRESDAQYTYTFTGWDPTPIAVTGDATYTAQYSSEVRSYTITWKNEDGNVLATDTVKYGDTPVYTGATPVKESDEGKDYTFDAWTPEVVPVTGDATYTATYREGAREYTITWANYDGTVLATDKVAYGETPAYTGETPTRVDGRYDYTFSGWNPEVVPVTGDATYTAQYTSSPKDMYIWLHETVSIRGTSTEKIVKYTVNQLKDLDENLTNGKASETSKLVVDGKFYLPDTQATEGDWTLIVNKGTENQVVSGTYRSGSVYLIDENDISTDGVIHFYALGADTPSTETQSITIAATGYYADADVAKDAINSAIKGLGLTSEITDVEKDTMFVIWYHATGGTFTGTLTFSDANGEAVTCDLGQHTSDKAGYGIFYFTSYKHEDGSENGYVDGFEKYVAGSQYTITIADGDVSAKVIAGNSGSDTPAPSTETSTEVRAAVVVDSDGVYLMMVAKDGKAIPTGTISVTYSYTETVMFHGQERTRSNTATFTQDYTADGNAYAYVLLDFQNKASENYDSVFGISAASFTYGQTTVNAGSASFTLPEIPETETRA